MPSKVDAVVNLGTEIPGYELLARLGGGGMGEVYLARRMGALGFEKLVALKTVLPKYKKRSTVEVMFLDEARTAARLNHPTIPQVYDFGEAGKTFYLAMEYVAGVPFDAIADMIDGPWPPAIAALAIAQVCRGLHSAHTLQDLAGRPLNIVHRDVSPNNLLMAFDGRVKLIDFGIALTRGRLVHSTDKNEIRGKMRYMSPEQLQRKKLTFKADIFSAGVVLYELLIGPGATRRLPLFGEAALEEKIEPVSKENPYVLPELNDIIMRALRQWPSERFDSAKEMARALEQHADGADLEDFAAETLGAVREDHQNWIRDLIDDDGEVVATERRTVPMPALPRRVSTSLHHLVDPEDPDDTAAGVAHSIPASGDTAPRIRPREPLRSPERDPRVEPDTGSHSSGQRPIVLVAGGAGFAAAIALLLCAVLHNSPTTQSPAPSVDRPPPQVANTHETKPVPVDSAAQAEIRKMRIQLDSIISGRGLIVGDDDRLDQALLIFDDAALEENISRAENAVRMAEEALAAVDIDRDFVAVKLTRLRRSYDGVDDAASLRRLNPIMKEIIAAHRSGNHREMNLLMNRAFSVIRTR